MKESLIVLKNVTKIYNEGQINEVVSVNNISLDIKKNEMIVLKGPSGSGKTTLIAMMGCLLKPTSGDINIMGKSISKLPEKFMNQFKLQYFGFIFQNFQLISELSVADNVELPLYPLGVKPAMRREMSLKLLERFNLKHRQDFKIKELSGGEQQRVAIIRAIINQPEILLADEPTAHLDTELSQSYLEYMKVLKVSGLSVIIASHDPRVCEFSEVDRVIEIKDGQLKL
ncbi:MAG: ABC transporter ATP-binding protein [Deltaproteobacteria bacterium]|jgi:putative ABC transport system ATP-binding protein|nr:ABC transporter ATP-binding protein [Deltaproteobacteria bacterium]